MRLFCFVQTTTLCRYGCMYFLAAIVLGVIYICCVDFASLDVVFDKLNDCAWYLGL